MHKKCLQQCCVVASFAIAMIATSANALAARPQAGPQVQIVDQAMCCAGCARNVSGPLYAVRGVSNVTADLSSRTLAVSLADTSPAVLGQLWHAVEVGKGTPTKLVTAEANYALVRSQVGVIDAPAPLAVPQKIVIENLYCQGCANKIGAQLYALKGVTKVSVDMQASTLFVEASRGVRLSPWALVEAVTKAGERPVAVISHDGELTIEWTAKASPKNHEQAQIPALKGTQR